MLTMIYQDILSEFAGDDGYITVSVEDLKNKLAEYYASWSGLQGEQSQIRHRWVVHALDTLHKIKLAKRLRDDRYRIDPLPRKKDLKDFLLDKMCSGSASTVQTGLDDF